MVGLNDRSRRGEQPTVNLSSSVPDYAGLEMNDMDRYYGGSRRTGSIQELGETDSEDVDEESLLIRRDR
jgi:hypothetical protein